jgi:hypothetical protein
MTLKYSMTEGVRVAKQASSDLEEFLKKFEETIEVKNVEDDAEYREKDIDLLWLRQRKGNSIKTTIEIKGDRWYKTGNYFFETISNKSKGTPGCFMYTEADYIFYYFVEQRELHVLPMPETREWFIKNIVRFKERETSTPVNNEQSYITVGRLVPRNIVKKEVPKMKIINL